MFSMMASNSGKATMQIAAIKIAVDDIHDIGDSNLFI
jgi:hypothetical protein